MHSFPRLALAAFAALICACTPTAPVAVNASDAVAVIRALYDPYLSDEAEPPAWREATPWTDDARLMVEAEGAGASQVNATGAFSEDPIVAAKQWQLSDLAVTVEAPPLGGRAVIIASFKNAGQDTVVRYDMVQTEAGWRVDNIRSGSIDLRGLLSRVAARREQIERDKAP